MKTIINSYIDDLSELEIILNTINYDRLLVFGGLTKIENCKTVVRSDKNIISFKDNVNRNSNFYYQGNSISRNLYPFDIYDNDIKDIVKIAGDKTYFIKDVSFSLYHQDRFSKGIISSWLTLLKDIVLDCQAKYNKDECKLAMSVSYVVHKNNNISLVIIEGSVNDEEDMRIRSELLDLLYEESEIEELDIRSILSKQLDYLSIPNYQYDEKNILAEISLSKSEYLSEEYIHDSTIKLENYINSINNIEMIGKSAYDKSIIYVYISLLYIFATEKKILTNVKFLSITNPLSLKFIN